MSVASHIAQRISFGLKGSFAHTATRLAITSVALGVGVLIIAFSILRGFQEKIRDKIYDFDAHVQISGFDLNNSFEGPPITTNSVLYTQGKEIEGIRHINVIAYQKGIIHANEQVYGVVAKGVSIDYDRSTFKQHLREGEFIKFDSASYSKEVIISDRMANQLKLKVGDPLYMYFYIEGKLRPKKMNLKGVYSTGLEEFDERIMLLDIRLIQRLNHWGDTLVGGYEIFLDDYNQEEEMAEVIEKHMDYDTQLMLISDKFHYIFDWLDVLLADNVNVLIGAIIIIVFFNIISTMYILMMERTPMVGLLKSLGATNRLVHQIFIHLGVKILLKGLLIGNFIGLGICGIQSYFKIIPLDPTTYYMSYVPIKWDVVSLIGINLLTILFVFLVLLLPLFIITRIVPVRAIKFD